MILKNRLTPDLAIFQIASPILIIREKIDDSQQWPSFVEQVTVPTVLQNNQRYIALAKLLSLLAERGFNDILVESGNRLAGAFIEQNLVDELILYQAPKLLELTAKVCLLCQRSVN